MTRHTFAPVQPLQCLPLRIRSPGAGVRLLLTLALALGTALGTVACGPETTPGNGNGGGAMDIAVAAGVTDVMPMGFTLTLQPGVPGIVPQDLTLQPAVAIATATANTGDMPNTRYTVKTEAWLARGREYTLTIAKAGYRIQAVSFTRSGTPSSEATITKMTLTVEGLAVEGDITGTDITFPYGTRGTGTTPTLTGTVSLELSAGAAVDGTNPADGMPQTYSSSQSQSITVLAEDGTTKQTYTVVITAYNATSNPYGVYTPAQLHAVREGLTANYRLMQDLALPNAGSAGCRKPDWAQAEDSYCTNGWKPIGTDTPASSQFTGTFDGNGHSISNLFIQRSSTDYVGLFGYVGTAGKIRNLGVHIAAAGVTGGSSVGGLVGLNYGAIANCYATGAVTGSGSVGGLMGFNYGIITNCYTTGAVNGGDSVGGLVGYGGGTVTNCYATGVVTGSSNVGGLVGNKQAGTVSNSYATGSVSGSSNVGGLVERKGSSGTVTNSYYPSGRPAGMEGTTGEALNSGAGQTDFSGFTFTGDTPAWKWVAGKWPQLNGFEAAQATPSLLTYHTAAVTSNNISTTEFTMTLSPSLSGLTKADWALYKVTSSSSDAVTLASVVDTGNGDGYTFTPTTTMDVGSTYHLLYTKADVIVVPETAGHIAIRAPNSTDVLKMTLTVDGIVMPGDIKLGDGTIIFYNAPQGSNASLTGTVSLVLAKDAQVVGANPGGNQATYTSAGTDLQVREGSGATTKTYTISVAAYDADTNPYGVYTAAQLHAVRNALSASYRLMQDLALPNAGTGCSVTFPSSDKYCEEGWKPIGTYTTRMNTDSHFTGTFDGNGHSISNLFIQRDTNYVGLFGYVGRGGTTRNLGVHTAAAGVTGGSQVGGLVGKNEGTITNCYATGAVTGGSNVGGLVGESESGGTITDCYATAAVTGSSRYVGGLVGWSTGAITNCYATGAVTGSYFVGGLAGRHDNGAIANCYATGAVTGSSRFVGGLVGEMYNDAAITNCYATGAVSGSDDVGGLVGTSSRSSATITDCYATGAVSGGTSNVGGLVGTNSGTVSNSYYPSGRLAGRGGTTGEALNSGAGQNDFKNFTFDNNANTGWKWVAGKWPQLNGFEAVQTTPSLLTYHTAAVTANSVSTTAFTMTLTPPLSGSTKADWALYKVPTSSSDAVTLASVVDTGNGGGYTFTTTTTMTAGTYRLLYTKADVIVVPETAGHITIEVPRNSTTVEGMTLAVHNVAVPATITHGEAGVDGTIIFPNAPKGDSVSLRGTVSLTLAGGAEVIDEPSPNGLEKTYTTAATALKVQAEDGTTTKTYNISVAAYNATANPYGVYTPAQLHAVRNALGASYRLMKDVTLPDTRSGCSESFLSQADYCTNGWNPIGTFTSATSRFTGTFDGNGHSISNLFIQRSDTSYVGLFGYVGTAGKIRNLGVHIAATGVTGGRFVGGLVGRNDGAITNSYATGAVTGRGDEVGGLVGDSTGTITNCYATGAVTGSSRYVGGLVGWSSAGSITNCYATGAVSGSSRVGGLVGGTAATITNCYATGAVTGSSNVGGLVGRKGSSGTVTNSYYPAGRPVTAGGQALSAGVGQTDFSGFTFDSNTNTGWKWVAGKWPQLNGFEAAQATPSLLIYHTATLTGGNVSTTAFTMTLTPSLSGLTKADWALYYKVTTSNRSDAVTLTSVADTGNGGSYTFTTTATMAAGTYNLLYTKADVIVVPPASVMPAGHITFTVPGS